MTTYIYQGEWNPNKVYDPASYYDSDTQTWTYQDLIQYQGAVWVANYYSLDQNPMAYAVPPGQTGANNQGNPFTLGTATNTGGYVTTQQNVNYDPVVPSWGPTTTDFRAGYTSDTSVSLFWNAAEVKGVGDVSSYDIFATNNVTHVMTLAGTTDTTAFTVTGLSASTSYTFTVDANDLTGTSGPQTMTGTNYNGTYTWNENPGAADNPTANATTTAPVRLSGQYFSPYLDMTLPTTDLLNISANSGLRDFSLAFMQVTNSAVNSDGTIKGSAIPTLSWGGLGTATTESTGTIIQEVNAVKAEGGTVTISIGGYLGHDPAVVAQINGQSAAQLQAEYQAVISTYSVDHLDFDIENAVTVNNMAANTLRDQAIVGLEAANPNLHVSYTVATLPNGLPSAPDNQTVTSNDLGIFQQAKADGVRIDTVNIMAMDYDDGDANPDMGAKAISAANAVHAQLMNLGIDAMIGITPMIGNNDDTSEVTTLADAQQIEAFAAAHPSWIAGVGEWELPRDMAGPDNEHQTPVQNQSGVYEQNDYEFAQIFNQIVAQPPTPHDFNGDGFSDVLWRNDSGQVLAWDMRADGTYSSDAIGSTSNAWQIQDTGDFNGDGLSDILWRNADGMVATWDLNASGAMAGHSLGNMSNSWHIEGVGDFNGDRVSDVLWQNSDGGVLTWDMHANGAYSSQQFGTTTSAWHIQGTGDFNGDGTDDILWQNNDGRVVTWDMHANGTLGTDSLGTMDSSWHVQGTGDFNGDGFADILWRNNNGDTLIWNMQANGAHTTHDFGTVSKPWHIADTGDFNADGFSDILWHNDSGQALTWDLRANETFTSPSIGTLPTSWQVADTNHAGLTMV